MQAFGGVASYASHWSWGVSDGGTGACFPGGHASSAFAFIALSLPWLTSMDTDQQRLGITMTRVILLTGLVLGLVQTLRGAHYPSHTAWTALVCAATAWANHGVFVWWRVKRELSAER
jgi:membrane-associated PAP2 superfamily phosphatase